MTNKEPKEEKIPRFVLSITDTTITVPGPNGDQYYAISVGADKLTDFNKLIPKAQRTNYAKTELQSMFVYFQDAVDKYEQDRDKAIIEEAELLVKGKDKDGKTIK